MNNLIIFPITLLFFGTSCNDFNTAYQKENCNLSGKKITKFFQDSTISLDFDSTVFFPDSIYTAVDSLQNKKLWYQEIETPHPTQYISYWNSYAFGMYYANHQDFLFQFENRDDIILAFQFGPQGPMWSYFTYIIKPAEDCFVAVQTTYTHARFVYKSISILNESDLKILLQKIKKLNNKDVKIAERGFEGFFISKKENLKFSINFDYEIAPSGAEYLPDVKDFFEFLDTELKWKKTYKL